MIQRTCSYASKNQTLEPAPHWCALAVTAWRGHRLCVVCNPLQHAENPMWFLKARYNGLTQRKWRSKGGDDFRLMYCIPYISALRCGPRKRFIILEGAQSLRIQRLHTYKAPSLSLVSVFPIAFPPGKPRLNTLHGLVPERSALFSAKGVLRSFFPVSNYAHGAALSAHNE